MKGRQTMPSGDKKGDMRKRFPGDEALQQIHLRASTMPHAAATVTLGPRRY